MLTEQLMFCRSSKLNTLPITKKHNRILRKMTSNTCSSFAVVNLSWTRNLCPKALWFWRLMSLLHAHTSCLPSRPTELSWQKWQFWQKQPLCVCCMDYAAQQNTLVPMWNSTKHLYTITLKMSAKNLHWENKNIAPFLIGIKQWTHRLIGPLLFPSFYQDQNLFHNTVRWTREQI